MVPNGWTVKKLKQIAEYRRGSFPQPYGLEKWFDPNGHPFVQVYDVDKNLRLKPKTKAKISDLAAEKSVFAPKGTVVVTLQGSIGRVAVTQYPAYIDRTLLIIQSFKDLADHRYFAICLQKLFAEEGKIAPGGTIKTITKAVLNNFEIIWPPFVEQKKISEILSTWDDAIAANEDLLANSRQRKKALMQQLLTGRARLPGFEGEWKTDKLSVLCLIEKGGALSSKDLVAGHYPVIAGGQSSPYSHNVYNHENVITVSASGAYAGFVALHRQKIWASDCSVIKAKNGSNIDYISHVMKHSQNHIYSLQSGGAQPHIYPRDLQSIKVGTPVKEEQFAIASILNTADEEVEALEQRINNLKTQKKALMQQLLTGKRRVKLN